MPLSSADASSIQHAIEFVRASRLRGGTDIQRALQAGLQQAAAPGAANTYLVILSDGGATRGPITNGKLATWYASAWKQLPETQRPRTYILAVGDDANLPLFRMLARQDGLLEHVLSTEPMEFKLNSFLSKIGRSPIGQLDLAIAPESAVDTVYPLQAATFSGSLASWVGRYQKPQENVSFKVHGVRDGTPVEMTGKVNLPRESFDHPQLPRLWARARVDALLEKIEREGEDQATIDEIIRLARQYKFVTPYTSFLAVPRALLRPRVIRPGDPVLARKDRRVDRLGRRAVSVRIGAAAALSLVRRHLADSLPCSHRHAGWNLHGAPHPARSLGTDVSRVEDVRDRQQAARGRGEARSQTLSSAARRLP